MLAVQFSFIPGKYFEMVMMYFEWYYFFLMYQTVMLFWYCFHDESNWWYNYCPVLVIRITID